MAAVRLALIPRDGMFFKDGRGWYASASGRGHAVPWPFPSTLLGAIRTAWGRSVEMATGQTFTKDDWRERTKALSLGATIALRRRQGEAWSASHRRWPVPADALYVEGARSVHRLDPAVGTARKIHTLGLGDEPAREALWRPDMPTGKPADAPLFWTDEELASWLDGRPVPALAPDEHKARAPGARIDLRIAIDPGLGTVTEGALFATETVEMLQRTGGEVFEWAIGVEAQLPEDATSLERVITLGSDRRLATWESLPPALFAPPGAARGRPAAASDGSSGLRLIAATPLCFERGWLPDGFDARGTEYGGRLPGVEGEVLLRAAFVPRATHVSGWDMVRNRPKETRRLVPGGAVYFFEKVGRATFTAAERAGLWLRPLGQYHDEGFGRVIAGPWEIRK